MVLFFSMMESSSKWKLFHFLIDHWTVFSFSMTESSSKRELLEMSIVTMNAVVRIFDQNALPRT
jgi:hypothetical protein